MGLDPTLTPCQGLTLRDDEGRPRLKLGFNHSRTTSRDCSHRSYKFQFSAEPRLYDCLRHERVRHAPRSLLCIMSCLPSRCCRTWGSALCVCYMTYLSLLRLT